MFGLASTYKFTDGNSQVARCIDSPVKLQQQIQNYFKGALAQIYIAKLIIHK